MTDAEFRTWLSDEVEAARMTARQRDDLMTQKAIFDDSRFRIEQAFRYMVVGYVSGVQLRAYSLHEILGVARERFPGGMLYFEPVGFHLF
jgi:hypothetical protein